MVSKGAHSQIGLISGYSRTWASCTPLAGQWQGCLLSAAGSWVGALMWPLGFRCGEMLPSIRLWIDLIPDLCFVQWPLPAVEWLHCTSWCSMKHNIVFRKSISIGQRWHTLHEVVTNASMDLQQKSLICTDGNIEPF